MNKETGQIKQLDQLTEKEKASDKWVELPPGLAALLMPMSRTKRKKVYSRYQNPTKSRTPSRMDRRQKRKAQRLARRKSRA